MIEAILNALREVPTQIVNSVFSFGTNSAMGNYVLKAVVSLLALLILYFVAKYVARIVAEPISQRVDQTLGRFINKLIFNSAMTIGVLCILSAFGVQSTSFATVLAATGFAIGLAFQGTLSNFAAGVLLLVFRPFKVGDSILAAGVTGKVHEIDLFTTVIDTPDNRRIIVPNSSIAGNTIENASYHLQRRIEVSVGIDYHASLDDTRAALNRAVESISKFVIAGPDRESQIVLQKLSASSVDWLVRVWVTSKDAGQAHEQLVYAVKTHLDAAGIGIPFPQLDVHFDSKELETIRSAATNNVKIRPRMRTNSHLDAA